MIYKFENTFETMSINCLLKRYGISERTIVKLRKKLGNLQIDKVNKTTRDIINKNQILVVNYEEKVNENSFDASDDKFDVVYEDDYVLIVDKPTNLCTIPTHSHFEHNLATAVLNYQIQTKQNFSFRAINRLDQDTSGFVVIAKDTIIYNLLLKFGNIQKKYLALVEGEIDEFGKIQAKICDDEIQRKRQISQSGKNATTNYTLVKKFEKFNLSLAEIELEHGRTNQIRVHFAHIGHPLANDTKYGGKQNDLLQSFFLRCYKLNFFHPVLKKEFSFELSTNLPSELRD